MPTPPRGGSATLVRVVFQPAKNKQILEQNNTLPKTSFDVFDPLVIWNVLIRERCFSTSVFGLSFLGPFGACFSSMFDVPFHSWVHSAWTDVCFNILSIQLMPAVGCVQDNWLIHRSFTYPASSTLCLTAVLLDSFLCSHLAACNKLRAG